MASNNQTELLLVGLAGSPAHYYFLAAAHHIVQLNVFYEIDDACVDSLALKLTLKHFCAHS